MFLLFITVLNTYLKAIQNAEIQANSEDFESESESDSENRYYREEELLPKV